MDGRSINAEHVGGQHREQPRPNGYTEERKEEILRATQERSSLRGIQRTFGVSRQTLSAWMKKKQTNSRT